MISEANRDRDFANRYGSLKTCIVNVHNVHSLILIPIDLCIIVVLVQQPNENQSVIYIIHMINNMHFIYFNLISIFLT